MKKYITSLELNEGESTSYPSLTEDFIFKTLTEVSQFTDLKAEMIKVRITYINDNGERRDRLVITSPLVNTSTFSYLIKEVNQRCEVLGITWDKVQKIHLHLILYYKNL